jgi:hypothetical protein
MEEIMAKKSRTLPTKKDLPALTDDEKAAALHQAALAKFAKRSLEPPAFCVNCGQEVKGQVALDSAEGTVQYCPIHGVRLRPDGSCPLED